MLNHRFVLLLIIVKHVLSKLQSSPQFVVHNEQEFKVILPGAEAITSFSIQVHKDQEDVPEETEYVVHDNVVRVSGDKLNIVRGKEIDYVIKYEDVYGIPQEVSGQYVFSGEYDGRLPRSIDNVHDLLENGISRGFSKDDSNEEKNGMNHRQPKLVNDEGDEISENNDSNINDNSDEDEENPMIESRFGDFGRRKHHHGLRRHHHHHPFGQPGGPGMPPYPYVGGPDRFAPPPFPGPFAHGYHPHNCHFDSHGFDNHGFDNHGFDNHGFDSHEVDNRRNPFETSSMRPLWTTTTRYFSTTSRPVTYTTTRRSTTSTTPHAPDIDIRFGAD